MVCVCLCVDVEEGNEGGRKTGREEKEKSGLCRLTLVGSKGQIGPCSL